MTLSRLLLVVLLPLSACEPERLPARAPLPSPAVCSPFQVPTGAPAEAPEHRGAASDAPGSLEGAERAALTVGECSLR
jgi:hypothetical protein